MISPFATFPGLMDMDFVKPRSVIEPRITVVQRSL